MTHIKFWVHHKPIEVGKNDFEKLNFSRVPIQHRNSENPPKFRSAKEDKERSETFSTCKITGQRAGSELVKEGSIYKPSSNINISSFKEGDISRSRDVIYSTGMVITEMVLLANNPTKGELDNSTEFSFSSGKLVREK
ncbi:hypothetical protein AYI69_g10560 [Smittium culicis]|uniref:Uncharacterized protein n=1 Tax=Smittium culicis TaxID=133412 RepID=A0A1R1X506_9FUNG|nr:hypothetical protein AYI69_g10560 [Smittium culicis]